MKNYPETLKKRNEKRAYWKKTIDPNSFAHAILRICKDCKQEKECRWNSSFSQTGLPEYKARCHKCWLKRAYLNVKKRRKQITSLKLSYKYKRKRKCIEYLGGKCAHCGYFKCDKALTFHHLDPKTKLKNVSHLLDRKWSILKSELDKCELLCFNCHMEEEDRLYGKLQKKMEHQ